MKYFYKPGKVKLTFIVFFYILMLGFFLCFEVVVRLSYRGLLMVADICVAVQCAITLE